MWRATALVIALGVSTAHADDHATAQKYFAAGSKAYAAQNFAAAATDFDEAYKVLPLPEIAFSAAQAYRRQYRVEPNPAYVKRAVELYRKYLAEVKSGGRVGDAADSLGELERELERLKLTGGGSGGELSTAVHTRLGISVTFADQEVRDPTVMREIGDATNDSLKAITATIDGARVEPFALVDVEARGHVIAVSADGYVAVQKQTVAVPGQSALIDIELKPRPATVTVKTDADARLTIDGRPIATPAELAAGKHLLAVVRRGREPFARELVVARGEHVAVDAPLRFTARRRALPWVLAGAGVLAVGTVTTGVLAIVHDDRASDLAAEIAKGNRPPTDADHYDQEVTSRDHDVTATWILGGAAVATGAVAAALYYLDMPESADRMIVPTFGGGAAGVSALGRF